MFRVKLATLLSHLKRKRAGSEGWIYVRTRNLDPEHLEDFRMGLKTGLVTTSLTKFKPNQWYAKKSYLSDNYNIDHMTRKLGASYYFFYKMSTHQHGVDVKGLTNVL